jgi:stage II sporulation protein GA (sporulation sigma-E factor processing peptidase)
MYAMTIFLGGLINFLYSYTYLGYMLQNVFRGMFQGINILWLSGVTTVSYLCIEGIIKYLKKINKYNMQVKVRLVINGRTKDIIALVDTGNSLREPYTGKPVHIVCMDSVLEMINDMDLYSGNLKYVPFQSIGKKNGLLKTIEFDEMLVYSIDKMSGEIKELIYKEESVIIGLFEGVLSGKSEFEMILHRSINLEGGLV